jgi:aerobic-type carbon monoxide dehydrogenase small subunit (CoxS/CutS family)
MSRRSFLRATGIAAAGTAVAEEVLLDLADTARAEPAVVGPGASRVTLDVNGARHTLEIKPQMTLAETLRGPLGLTGTKIGCDRGACSACTVWVDGTPVASCMMLAIDIGDRKVTTIEGLARGNDLHPVQSAFIAHDAVQCGFCTPGLVMSCAALLERNPHPSLEEVKAATSGHLCRCGTYPHVFAATLAAAKDQKG